MEAGSGEKVEEFVVLHQEPSASEAISPRVARPYIQALHSINLDTLPSKKGEQEEEEELAGKESTEDNQESEIQAQEEPAQKEELNAVMEQVPFTFFIYNLEIRGSGTVFIYTVYVYTVCLFVLLSLYLHLLP